MSCCRGKRQPTEGSQAREARRQEQGLELTGEQTAEWGEANNQGRQGTCVSCQARNIWELHKRNSGKGRNVQDSCVIKLNHCDMNSKKWPYRQMKYLGNIKIELKLHKFEGLNIILFFLTSEWAENLGETEERLKNIHNGVACLWANVEFAPHRSGATWTWSWKVERCYFFRPL